MRVGRLPNEHCCGSNTVRHAAIPGQQRGGDSWHSWQPGKGSTRASMASIVQPHALKAKFQPPHPLTDHVQVLRNGPQLGCERERDRKRRHMGKDHWHSLMHVMSHVIILGIQWLTHTMGWMGCNTSQGAATVRLMPAPTSAAAAAAAAAAIAAAPHPHRWTAG